MLVATGMLVATTAATVIGAAIGTITRSLPVAVAVPVLWIDIVEPLIAQVSYPLYMALPGGIREALLRHTSLHHHTCSQPASLHHHISSQPVGLAIAAGWCLAFAAASRILANRDVD